MTMAELKAYLLPVAKQAGFSEESGLDAFIDSCIKIGLEEFWTARNWSIRYKQGTLTIASLADDHTLPSDFDALRSILAPNAQRGDDIRIFGKARFEQLFPDVTASGKQTALTTFSDGGVMKIRFDRRPAINEVFRLDYSTIPPSSTDSIPGRFTTGLVTACQKAMIPVKSPVFLQAERAAQEVYTNLERRDRDWAERLERFQTADETPRTDRPWVPESSL